MLYRVHFRRVFIYVTGTLVLCCIIGCLCRLRHRSRADELKFLPASQLSTGPNMSIAQESNARSKLCFLHNGRLGNQLFQYAAVVGIAQEKGMVAAVEWEAPLAGVFELGAEVINREICQSYYIHQEKRFGAFDDASVAFDGSTNTALTGSYQSWRYFRHVAQELRRHFVFKSEILDAAKSVLSSAVLYGGYDVFPEQTLVGIHVRRGDMLTQENMDKGYVTAPRDYYLRAMDFFRGRFRSVVFVICSEDLEWPQAFLPRDKAVFIQPQSAEVDLAVLSLCDHVIMGVGSFGWWAGWLAGGITVYYKNQVVRGSLLDQGFDLKDYMPPEWVGLD